MVKIHAQKEFTEAQMKRQREHAKDKSLPSEEREKAREFLMAMHAYNMRALRGDFDTY